MDIWESIHVKVNGLQNMKTPTSKMTTLSHFQFRQGGHIEAKILFCQKHLKFY